MPKSVIVFCSLLLLSGCSMGDDLFSFGSRPKEETPVEPAPQPVAKTAPDDSFCRAVATQDATRDAFDLATQQRVAAQSYTQCMTMTAR